MDNGTWKLSQILQLLLCVDKEENVIPKMQAKQLGFQGDGALPHPKRRKSPPAETKIILITEITSTALMCLTVNAAKTAKFFFLILKFRDSALRGILTFSLAQ